jgi:glutathione S-transferase
LSHAPIVLYDLAGADDAVRTSPFCWRIRMALAHNGLACEAVPWRLVEKDRIVGAGSVTVPVIVDGGRVVADSWRIAEYLDRTYPERPLFDSPQSLAYARWIHYWTERVLHPLIVPLILQDVLDGLHPMDVEYFVRTREQAYGQPIRTLCDRSVDAYARFAAALSFVRRVLRESPFVAGDAPAYADYILFGAFQWARCCSPVPLEREAGEAIAGWLVRMLDLFDGLARNAARYDTLHRKPSV